MISTQQLGKVQKTALIAGLAALVLCAVGGAISPNQALRSFLVGHLFWWSIVMGCLGLLMLNHLVGGRWGYETRPIMASVTATLPLLALLFIPVAVGLGRIYIIWSNPEEVARDHLLQDKAAYLSPWFFRARAVGYFVVWIVYARIFDAKRPTRPKEQPHCVSAAVSGSGLLLLVLTLSFASIDWVMSLDPRWYSTIYGMLIGAGGMVAAMAWMAGVVALGPAGRPDDEDRSSLLNDLGSFLLAFLMLWSYFAFSQYLIIWSGNLPHEITWYKHRLEGGWQWVALLIVVFHFVVPFALLLSRQRRRSPRSMLWIAALVLLIHYVDLFWNVAPFFSQRKLAIHWLDFVAPVAIGGLWVAMFAHQLKRRLSEPAP